MGRSIDRALFWLGGGQRGYAFFFGCLAVGALFAVSGAVPLPFDVRRVEIDQLVACPDDSISISVNRAYAEPGVVYGYGEIQVTSTWIEVSTGRSYEALTSPPFPPNLDPLDGWERARYQREAPPDPGTYRLRNAYDLSGRTMVLPDDAYANVDSSDTLTVVDGYSCRQGAGG